MFDYILSWYFLTLNNLIQVTLSWKLAIAYFLNLKSFCKSYVGMPNEFFSLFPLYKLTSFNWQLTNRKMNFVTFLILSKVTIKYSVYCLFSELEDSRFNDTKRTMNWWWVEDQIVLADVQGHLARSICARLEFFWHQLHLTGYHCLPPFNLV